MSEAAAQSQTRVGELVRQPENAAAPPLVSLADTKSWFGLTETTYDTQLTLAIEAVSQAIRAYTGRYLTLGSYVENFRYVRAEKSERFLSETPVVVFDSVVNNGAALLNRNTGHVYMTAGELCSLTYDGGYQTLPADLTVVFYDLVRQQMAAWGVDQLGTSVPATNPQEKAVTLGTLKVEYAISAVSAQAKSAGAGGISSDALAPYASVLDGYRSHRRLAST